MPPWQCLETRHLAKLDEGQVNRLWFLQVTSSDNKLRLVGQQPSHRGGVLRMRTRSKNRQARDAHTASPEKVDEMCICRMQQVTGA